ncbi:hypothetical protein E2C01_099419 [Portunus trituberculatus]|uniref:Uncharacterized protein n=1 Tax=Portunus trituberculatus TaxID=210409 RepID=A0A5B7KAB5_PORTR|nr:hypothetical protein [Portunus trituberculatus]
MRGKCSPEVHRRNNLKLQKVQEEEEKEEEEKEVNVGQSYHLTLTTQNSWTNAWRMRCVLRGAALLFPPLPTDFLFHEQQKGR